MKKGSIALKILYNFLVSRGASMTYYLLVVIHIECIIKNIGTNRLYMIILFSWYDVSISLVIKLAFDGWKASLGNFHIATYFIVNYFKIRRKF